MKYLSATNAYLESTTLCNEHCELLSNLQPSELVLLWFQEDNNVLIIDDERRVFHKNQVVCLTEFHQVKLVHISNVKAIKWNKFFYCVINHDSEVGCKGILFYGAVELPVIELSLDELRSMTLGWNLLDEELKSENSMQEEMLQMTLKRLLIHITRVYKKSMNLERVDEGSMDLIREYYFLVEQHFLEKHSVAEYADLMAKSPKTLANAFKKLGAKSPQQFIKERRMLEARRMLSTHRWSISEVGYRLGFSDVQSFSRFFKREEGVSPVNFSG